MACCRIQIGDQRFRLAASHDSSVHVSKGKPMVGPSIRIWLLLSSVCAILLLGHADAQQPPPTQSQAGAPNTPPAAQNPYLMGSEGYGRGPRGLTSFQPIAIPQPFADRMAQDVAARAAIEREHQAMLEE